MDIGAQIKSYRKDAGLTQEQLAGRLGVSTPAVNKWEKGVTCPDIALLPALARLLKTDINTLLGFEEDLTQEEIANFIRTLSGIAASEGVERAFAAAAEKIRAYPGCHNLIYNAAVAMDGLMVLNAAGPERIEGYEDSVTDWYEQAAQSRDTDTRDAARYMLAAKRVGKRDLEGAKALLEEISNAHPGKVFLQIEILRQEGRLDEAVKRAQSNFLRLATETLNALHKLTDIQLAREDRPSAQYAAGIADRLAGLLDLWPYNRIVPRLVLAAYDKDADAAVRLLAEAFEAARQPWDAARSPLYDKIAMKGFSGFGGGIIRAMLREIDLDAQYAFLRGHPGFEALRARYAAAPGNAAEMGRAQI